MTTKTEKRIAWAVLVAILAAMFVLSNAHAQVAISALPNATTPLAGTEVVPLVQSGVTSKVTVTNLRGTPTPAGSTTQVQFNNAGALGASADLTFDDTANALLVGATTGGLVQSASGVPFVVGNSAGNTSLTLRSAGTSNMLFQSGGVTQMTLLGSTRVFDIASTSGLTSSAAIQTLGGANFIANSTGSFFQDTANPAYKSVTDTDTGMGIRTGNVNTIDFTCGGAACGVISAALPLSTVGSFTITLTACAAGTTGTADYSITGRAVTLRIPLLSCTSNAAITGWSGIPAVITPVNSSRVFFPCTDNGGAAQICNALVQSGGTFNLGTGLTAGGTKTVPATGFTISYLTN